MAAVARAQVQALIIELIPHLDAGDRALWRGDQDERTLSELGRRQAAVLARALAEGPVDGLFSSPALRCVQTLEPLSSLSGRPVITLAGLREQQRGQEGDDALAERGLSAIEYVVGSGSGDRIIVCSHGDVIPAAVELLVRRQGLTLRSRLSQRGEWYTITLRPDKPSIRLNGAPEGFPR